MIGVKLSEIGQIVLICLTVTPIVITTIIGFLHADLANLTPFAPYGFTNVAIATKAVIFGFFGFEAGASLYALVKNPEKNVPKALTYSIVLVGILYLAFVASIIVSVPLQSFTSPEISVTKILGRVFPQYTWLISALGISILSAVLGTLHSMIWSASALLLSFFNRLKNPLTKSIVKSHYNSQLAVLIIGSCILLSAVTFKDLDLFFSFTAIFILCAFVSSMITLLVKKTSVTDKIITIAGMATAGLIFMFAVQEVVKQLT
jgi:amino acid transporter